MLDSKPVYTPMDPNTKLVPDKGELLTNPEQYRRLVGKLNYLTVTRPDIAFATSMVSQFLSQPRTSHWNAVISILRYLKTAPGKGLLYKNHGHTLVRGHGRGHTLVHKHNSTPVQGYSDADWADSQFDRRSTTGYYIFLGGNLVSWKSKKQIVVAKSSAESEYRAMTHTTAELVWLKNLLDELGFQHSQPMELICDNQATLHIASNPIFHERTKHIEVDCHFVREKLMDNTIKTTYVKLEDQLADLFTKSLIGNRLRYLCNKLGTYNPYAPA
ncbi:Retrovirus-related Pol polyprotein from transposon TNT 1-94 [Quillaja saponaria]|uniref:Retrovirus-related Pol polyprotein from transposon TNT 1-94 n=1 Tax=Quillaja saponaria TaxID=32244 RepID=A0AAD7QJ32_QUISA|nr:Retrovirus-related Pol polyprotein from transposon TNT 1-94 [Quillaja saponaria]